MLWNDWRVQYVARILAVFCFPPTVFAQATHQPLNPTNIPAASALAQPIFELSFFVPSITDAVVVMFFALLAYSVVKFRRRTADGRKPAQVYGSNQSGLAWTVIPILIVMTVFSQQRECWRLQAIRQTRSRHS